MMYQALALNVETLAQHYLILSEEYEPRYNAICRQFLMRFVEGTQTRVDVREGQVRTTRTSEEGTYCTNATGGYETLRDAFIGWVGLQGWRSVLEWWGVTPKLATVYVWAPTQVVNVLQQRVTEEKYINVIPVPKDYESDQMRFAYYKAAQANKVRDFELAIEDYSEFAWLTSTPPTRAEVDEALKGIYRDHNYAMYMSRYL